MNNTINTLRAALIRTIAAQLVAEATGDNATLSIVHSTQELLMGQLLAVYPVDRNAAWSCLYWDYEEAAAAAAKSGRWPY